MSYDYRDLSRRARLFLEEERLTARSSTGAHEGKGLGNKFLDDLRHADALVHVVDVSGTTDAEGEES